ncbi:MAG: thiopurine S-methyltransferase [Chlorobi bacterium]|nr:thiopurine S-methyltransferase [Chlorobiota bacterium]
MKVEFWQRIWEERLIPFHQTRINLRLKEAYADLRIPEGGLVFVPLCGKAYDMRWLALQGHPVLGVELSPIAVKEFFDEGGVKPVVRSDGRFERWSGRSVEILLGDFFDLDQDHLSEVRGFYDRAALIALPVDMRLGYTDKLKAALPNNVRGLLLTIEYDQSKMEGPPFSVPEDEVRSLFGPEFHIERWQAKDVREQSRFRERLSSLVEKVYIISRSTRQLIC